MGYETKVLPAPIYCGMPLTLALGRRRTSREFSRDPLDDATLSTLLWACSGNTSPDGRRTFPSTLNLQSVRAYAFLSDGVWRYVSEDNTLERVSSLDARLKTTNQQLFVGEAPLTIVFVAELDRCQSLVESDYKHCLLVDAGCMVQACQLAATALGLASVARASFQAQAIVEAIGRQPEELTPLMTITIGKPA